MNDTPFLGLCPWRLEPTPTPSVGGCPSQCPSHPSVGPFGGDSLPCLSGQDCKIFARYRHWECGRCVVTSEHCHALLVANSLSPPSPCILAHRGGTPRCDRASNVVILFLSGEGLPDARGSPPWNGVPLKRRSTPMPSDHAHRDRRHPRWWRRVHWIRKYLLSRC